MNRPHSRYTEGCHINLIRERLARGWSHNDISKLLNVSRSTYSQLEAGDRTGSEYIWDDLAKLFNVDKDFLKK